MSDNEEKKAGIDLAALRDRLANSEDKPTWRSLEELADAEEFREALEREFPRQVIPPEGVNRRDFLKLMAASLGLAGLTACTTKPAIPQQALPYSEAPENLIPGKPMFFATAMELGGYARGVWAESHMGRPTKIEGNAAHPASLGATDHFAQGSVLQLYDPDRAQVVSNQGQASTWENFISALNDFISGHGGTGGLRLSLLTETVTSPTLAAQIQSLLDTYPNATWHQYDPAGRDQVNQGAQLAFGEVVDTRYDFSKANVVLSLDSNFFFQEPGNLQYVRRFTERRQVYAGQVEMNRLYAVESTPTITGAMADHRLPLRPSLIEQFARALAKRLGVDIPADEGGLTVPAGWLDALVADLQGNSGTSLVIAGPQQTPAVHALAHAMNAALNNVGQTVIYTDPVEANPVNQSQSLLELAQSLQASNVDLLVMIEGNPAYATPADIDFAALIPKAGMSVYLGLYNDETAQLATWHIPNTHYLEMWSDTRAFDGTAAIIQPLIAPLYKSKSRHELLAVLLGQPPDSIDGFQIVQNTWKGIANTDNFNLFWRRALHDGVVEGTTTQPGQFTPTADLASAIGPAQPPPSGMEIVFAPDHSVWDGRFANVSWLQELPRPLTKLVWDNAAFVSPATAIDLGLATDDVVELRFGGRSVQAPIWILPGQPDNVVTVNLGYGRKAGANLVVGQGFNAYAIRTLENPWFGGGLEVAKTGETYRLVSAQHHWSMEGRDLVRTGTLAQFQENPEFIHEGETFTGAPPSLYPEYQYEGYAWGMSINLSTCIGCSACVVACQAENNIPVVGKDQVAALREMQWLRIDRYYTGDLENPTTLFQPLPCMHCEKAPCEPVCPTEATEHSSEGLNEMTYNRCVGTRYCSNNCPYKVRRFNFYQYTDAETIPLRLVRNPDVTVRMRGVMEKCTYCVQRIQEVRVESEKLGVPIPDGSIQTACQQACPANAITFGDISDPNNRVRQLKEQPHNYGLLAEIGTQPRTSYLAKLRNPNPNLTERT